MSARTTKNVEEKPTTPKYNYGTGRRKTAIAQVRVLPGTGVLYLNDQPTQIDIRLSRMLELVGVHKSIDISAHVHGGGITGQLAAICHGVARALLSMNPDFRTTLKKAGFLTRDPREKERKKPGLHGARRGPQFSKR